MPSLIYNNLTICSGMYVQAPMHLRWIISWSIDDHLEMSAFPLSKWVMCRKSVSFKIFVVVIPVSSYQRKDWAGVRQILFWYDNKKDLKRRVFTAHDSECSIFYKSCSLPPSLLYWIQLLAVCTHCRDTSCRSSLLSVQKDRAACRPAEQ